MHFRKTLAIIFAAAVGLPISYYGLKEGVISSADTSRQVRFSKAEVYNMATERLYYRNAISQETYHQRQGYFAACADVNQQLIRALKERQIDKIRNQEEIFSQLCTMPAPKL